MSTSSSSNVVSNALQVTSRTVLRQVKFPSFFRAVTETLLFSGVFLAAGHISLGVSLVEMLVPMVPIVFVMMLSMVCSGVYRPEITNSIMNLFTHSCYGYVFGSVMFVASVHLFAPEFATLKFQFFFLFFSFFIMNTMRPLISGTDFMDGGGRRTN